MAAFASMNSTALTERSAPVPPLRFTDRVINVDLETYPYAACLNATTDAECVAAYRPPIRHDLSFTVLMTVTYAVLALAGVFGNALVIIVVSRQRDMHTAPNVYLLNLAIADLLLVLTGLPMELHEYWYAYPHPGGAVLGPALCILRHWASELCAYATVLTICAFTFERACSVYYARIFGVSQSQSANRRVILANLSIWVVAGAFAALVSYQWRIQYVQAPDGRQLLESAICVPLQELYSPILFIVPAFVFFFVPMILITILYLLIWRAISLLSKRMSLSAPGCSETSAAPWGNTGSVTSAHHHLASLRQQFNHAACGHQHNRLSEQQQATSGLHCSANASFSTEQTRQHRRTTTVIKVQTAVTLTFFICWAPFHSQRLVVTFGHPELWSESQLKLYHVFNAIAGIMYYLEACINPAIYNLLSKKFRQAFHSTLVTATNPKNYCNFLRLPNKALMARFYGEGDRLGRHQHPGRPGHFVQPMVRPHMLGVDSAMEANVALLQRLKADQPEHFGENGSLVDKVAGGDSSSNANNNRNDHHYYNGQCREMIEMQPKLTNRSSLRRKVETTENSPPNLAQLQAPSIRKISDEKLAFFNTRQSMSMRQVLVSTEHRKSHLCQHCKHAPKQGRRLSAVTPSSSLNAHSQHDASKCGSHLAGLWQRRRNSDLPTVISSSQAVGNNDSSSANRDGPASDCGHPASVDLFSSDVASKSDNINDSDRNRDANLTAPDSGSTFPSNFDSDVAIASHTLPSMTDDNDVLTNHTNSSSSYAGLPI